MLEHPQLQAAFLFTPALLVREFHQKLDDLCDRFHGLLKHKFALAGSQRLELFLSFAFSARYCAAIPGSLFLLEIGCQSPAVPRTTVTNDFVV